LDITEGLFRTFRDSLSLSHAFGYLVPVLVVWFERLFSWLECSGFHAFVLGRGMPFQLVAAHELAIVVADNIEVSVAKVIVSFSDVPQSQEKCAPKRTQKK